MELTGIVLHPGMARAPLLVLDEPLSFWGGFDPGTGRIIDRHHPQRGSEIAGQVLAMPGSRGSAGTPAGVAEAIRRGCGPAAILLGARDVNVAIGAMVAARLYGLIVPVVTVETCLESLPPDGIAEIAEDGRITIT
ncbi:MAG: DUF126 domain-containing protein [Paracoccaceae bacterium]|nr:DUF126 domain-containing protein [Paracoccaceae bacterium]